MLRQTSLSPQVILIATPHDSDDYVADDVVVRTFYQAGSGNGWNYQYGHLL